VRLHIGGVTIERAVEVTRGGCLIVGFKGGLRTR